MAIRQLEEAHDKAIKEKAEEISEQKDKIIQGKENQMQEAANSLYGADNAFSFYQEPERLDLIINNRVKEAQSAIGVNPTLEAIKEENERLKIELDTSQTTLSDLQKTHEKKVSENSQLVEATRLYQNELMKLAEQKDAMEKKFSEELLEEQRKLNEANDKIIAYEKERGDSREARIAMLTRISVVCGLIALGCLAGAIWSPAFKDKFAVMSGAAGFIAIAVWYIEPWHIAIVAGIVILSLIGWILYKFNVSRKVNVALVNKLQDDKDKDPEKFKTVDRPALEEWTTKVKVKSDGTIHKAPDKQVIKEIDKILVEGNRK